MASFLRAVLTCLPSLSWHCPSACDPVRLLGLWLLPPGIANVTLATITLHKKFAWFTTPKIYFSCKRSNETLVMKAPVEALDITYNMTGDEEWQVRDHGYFVTVLFCRRSGTASSRSSWRPRTSPTACRETRSGREHDSELYKWYCLTVLSVAAGDAAGPGVVSGANRGVYSTVVSHLSTVSSCTLCICSSR